MKKSLLFSAALMAASSAAMAQNGVTVLPNPTDAYTMGFVISADGKYVAGRYDDDVTAFVSDWQNAKTYTATTDEEDEYSFMNNVANNGTAFGYIGSKAATISIDGTTKLYGDSTIIKDGTNDATVMVGNEYNNDLMYPHAVIWDAEGNMTHLPEPSDLWAGFTVNGTSAEFITDDKQTIVGYMVDDMYTCPLVVWHLNRDGKTYSVDPTVAKKYFAAGWDTEHPYIIFMPTGLSDNGQWVALTVNDQNYFYGMARYDLVNDVLEVSMSDDDSQYIYTTGIADDGTMLGYIGYGEALIWKAGEEKYATLAETFPGATKLADFDENGDHAPFGISADGRYIVGQGYLAPESEEQYYNDCYTYVLDTQDEAATNAIKSVKQDNSATAASTTVKARYNLAGQRTSARQHGISILKMGDNSTRKVLKK